MPRPSSGPKRDTFSFRLGPDMKAALALAAAEEHKQPVALMRALLEAHLASRQRRAFEEEARRQSFLITARADEPGSDEASVMGALGTHLDADDFGDEWQG